MPHKFNVYKSSAGSGKTFTLTKEYLKIALRDPAEKFRTILAITFTVKATNEMKARILEAAEAFANAGAQPLTGRNKALMNALIEDENFPMPVEMIQQNARILYTQILHNYGDFGVSTIDSFSQRLIRSFAFELQLPVNFEVELDQDKVVEVLTDSLIGEIGDDKAVTELLTEVFLDRLIEKDSITIRPVIERSAKEMLDDKSMEHLEQLRKIPLSEFGNIFKTLQKKHRKKSQHIKKLGDQAINIWKLQGLSVDDFAYKKSGPAGFFIKISEGTMPSALARIKSAIEEDKGWYTGKTDENIKSQIDEVKQSLSALGEEILHLLPEISLLSLLINELSTTALTARLARLYNDYRREENIILISEFNQLIAKEVKGQPAPFIFEKVGDLYDHLLIDEFQDTSVIQWQNMLPLLEESLAKEEENLIVGDSKQAIYRWRGGETRQLAKLPELIGAENDQLLAQKQGYISHYFHEETLDSNFRSSENVVHFNNALYTSLVGHDEFLSEDVYAGYSQVVYHQRSGGFVSIQTFEDTGKDQEAKETDRNARLQAVVEHIKSSMQRGYNYSDIAILNRGNKENQWVAEALSEAGIPFISQESLRLRRSAYVRLLPALVQLMRRPSDQVIQAQVVNALLDIGLLQTSRHELHSTIAHQKMTSFHQFANWVKIVAASDELDLSKNNTADLLSTWENIVSWLPVSEQGSAFVSFFRNELWNFISQNGNNTEAFLDWWEEKQEKLFIKSADQAVGVQIMTIHRSKGLEFDIVILPFADWEFRPSYSKEYKWLQPPIEEVESIGALLLPLKSELEEGVFSNDYAEYLEATFLDNLNLLYVATTRAVKELHIFCSDAPKSSKSKRISRIRHLLHYFLQEHGTIADGYELGTPTEKSSVGETKDKVQQFELVGREREAAGGGLAVKNKSSVIWSDEVRGKIDFGETVHALLAETQTPDMLYSSLEKALSRGWINSNDLPQVERLLQTVIQHQRLAHYFTEHSNIFCEQPIVKPDGSLLIPDRMIRDQKTKTIQLLDFKTGTQQSKHEKQVWEYAQTLTDMGYRVTEILLVYIDPFEIKEMNL